ncbi:hypothetical protein AVEN_203202-1 [Araneus ventricosus]|uniref:Uncharacterized protein n=1 Tax=Araneus ventricosus TaxID=182803 RepID=A0A4Y2B1V2_ARAVE|nr:hypothetical protein AVEN_203202-1 [Araneus ventricosus]
MVILKFAFHLRDNRSKGLRKADKRTEMLMECYNYSSNKSQMRVKFEKMASAKLGTAVSYYVQSSMSREATIASDDEALDFNNQRGEDLTDEDREDAEQRRGRADSHWIPWAGCQTPENGKQELSVGRKEKKLRKVENSFSLQAVEQTQKETFVPQSRDAQKQQFWGECSHLGKEAFLCFKKQKLAFLEHNY